MTLVQKLINFSKSHDIESVGLVMQNEFVTEWYDCTPKNSLSFASTGGDGVHFSILTGFEEDNSPVIITVPMCFGEESLVIAENFKEFLDLGCRFGYFSLEQLCYDFESTVQNIAEQNILELEDQNLILLTNEFGLNPLKEVGNRIEQLNEKYAGLLEIEHE